MAFDLDAYLEAQEEGWALRPLKGDLQKVELYHVASGETMTTLSHPYMAEAALRLAKELGDNEGRSPGDSSWNEWMERWKRGMNDTYRLIPCESCDAERGDICTRPSGHPLMYGKVHSCRTKEFDRFLTQEEGPWPRDMHAWLLEREGSGNAF